MVALSANTDSNDVKEALNSGMSGFFPKPVKIPVLLKELQSHFMSDEFVDDK